MVKLPLLDLDYHGQVEQYRIQEIQDILEECYSRLSDPLAECIEIHLFDKATGLTLVS